MKKLYWKAKVLNIYWLQHEICETEHRKKENNWQNNDDVTFIDIIAAARFKTEP